MDDDLVVLRKTDTDLDMGGQKKPYNSEDSLSLSFLKRKIVNNWFNIRGVFQNQKMTQVRMICACAVSVLLLLLANNVAGAGWLNNDCSPPCISGDESIMSQKEHGTSHTAVQSNLRWGCDGKLADRIWYVNCCEFISIYFSSNLILYSYSFYIQQL
jgi:hypothetical protein